MSDEPRRLPLEELARMRENCDVAVLTFPYSDIASLLEHSAAIEAELAAAKQRTEGAAYHMNACRAYLNVPEDDVLLDGIKQIKQRAEELEKERDEAVYIDAEKTEEISALEAELAQAKESLASIEAELAATKEARGG